MTVRRADLKRVILLALVFSMGFAACGRSGNVLIRRTESTSDGGADASMGGASASLGGGEGSSKVDASGGALVETGDSPFPSDSSGGAGGAMSASGGSPPSMPFEGTTSSLSLGDSHSCLVTEGQLVCFGEGGDGALGNGAFSSRLVPTKVPMIDAVVQVSSGARHTCALLEEGSVLCSGDGSSGQLGNGSFDDSSEFVPVDLPLGARLIEAGHDHSCALLTDGRLYCWGANAEGQLAQDDPFPAPGPASSIPLQVASGWAFSSVGAGQGHTCAIRDDGSLYCWGRNAKNELGLGDAAPDQIRVLERVGTNSDWVAISAGQNSTCGLRVGGRLECWGDNSHAQLGLGDRMARDLPTLVLAEGVAGVSLETFHACVILDEGLACSGRGAEGALGTGTDDQLEFQLVPNTDGALLVAVGRFHTCLTTASEVRCAGENLDGRLGVGDADRRDRFAPLMAIQAP